MDHNSPLDIDSVVRVLPTCTSCELEKQAGVEVTHVRPAQWALTLRDCCAGWTPSPHLGVPHPFRGIAHSTSPSPMCGVRKNQPEHLRCPRHCNDVGNSSSHSTPQNCVIGPIPRK